MADIDIDDASHLRDFPARIAQYHGSLYWSGYEVERRGQKESSAESSGLVKGVAIMRLSSLMWMLRMFRWESRSLLTRGS